MYIKARKILTALGVNRAVFWGVLSKIWFGLASLVTIVLIVKYFSPELQGYYFTFYSFLSMQVFVELGLTAVIINFASHEWANLSLNENGEIIGDRDALSRLGSLAKIVFKWYRIGGALLVIAMAVFGCYFFSRSGQADINWLFPWLSLCVVTGINLSILPSFSLLEGCNQVSQVYFYRFVQEIVRSSAIWCIIMIGGGLWALPGATVAIILWAAIFLIKKYFNYFRSLFSNNVFGQSLSWSNEIWPLQWRIAVSWLSGYFFYSIITPVIFYFQGAVIAGQAGLTLNITNAVSVIASMWIFTRVPQFGMMVAKKEYHKLDKLMFNSGSLATVLAFIGAVIIFFAVEYVYMFQSSFAARILPPLPTLFFLLAAVFMQVSYAQSAYLRAHKQEPFLWLSVIAAVLMTVFIFIFGKRWGALGIAVSYFSIIALFIVPYGTYVWAICRNRWHAGNKA